MENQFNIYNMFNLMVDNQLVIIYQGFFDQDIIRSMITMTEQKLIQEQVDESLRRKLFNVMVEGLQNICKHQLKTDSFDHNPFLMIGSGKDHYNMSTGNLIARENIHMVEEKLAFINTLNRDELKEHHKQSRLKSVISSVGGAGLGFIDMARKSGNKLEYHFYDVNESYSFFVLYTKISNT